MVDSTLVSIHFQSCLMMVNINGEGRYKLSSWVCRRYKVTDNMECQLSVLKLQLLTTEKVDAFVLLMEKFDFSIIIYW